MNHISFNSLGQWNRYKHQILKTDVSPGLRVNPEHQEAETELYDPSAPGSRLGIRAQDLHNADIAGIEGLHIHNLCESDSFATERTFQEVEDKCGTWLSLIHSGG